MESIVKNKMSIYQLIWNVGARFRNPSVFKIYGELKASEAYSLSQLETLQFERLKETLIFAQSYSPFYAQKFAGVNFNPVSDFKNIKDISKIPVVTKADLLTYNQEIHTNYPFKKYLKRNIGYFRAGIEV